MWAAFRTLVLVFSLAGLLRSTGGAVRAGQQSAPAPMVVINEIHCDPDVKTQLLEFVELHNAGADDIDLSDWHFSDGIAYVFPPGTTLRAGGYIVAAQDPDAIRAEWGAGRFGLPKNSVFGPFAGRLDNAGERVALCSADGRVVDEVTYQLGFPWPTVGDPISDDQPGTGCSMQLTNPAFDNDLAGSWRSARPTPVAVNKRAVADNIPPHIRQVKHSPKQPGPGAVVTITAKVTDPDGVASVTLHYQLVDPGHYIRRQYSDGNNRRPADPEYQMNWGDMPMFDDGLAGDERAADSVYTARMPAAMQTHRRLVRYRITVEDNAGLSIRVPYSDDPQPNFAYFVYDDVPAWSGAVEPGKSNRAKAQVVTYGTAVMRSLPVYHLIAKKEDVEECQFTPISDARCNEEASWYQWSGTLVYDGVVYDHIWYRARGGWATHAFGKNRWKFDFNRGHYFQARDDYGNAYKTTWDKLNFSACFQFANTNNRGEHGMYEAVTAKLMNLADVPCFHTNWLHFRVIDDEQESGPTQYDGDFWGLYLAIEQPDGRFLDEHGLPDGNLYKMYFACTGNRGNKNNQGPTQVTDHSDVIAFCQAYQSYPADRQWWEENTNLDVYYSYRTICDAVHHYDLTDRWNCLYYAHPQTGRWWMLPWDFDHSWDSDIYTDDDEYWKQVLDRRFFQGHSVGTPGVYHRFGDCIIAFQNRLRELSDLLLNADECGRLITEYAAVISRPAEGQAFVEADRALWDHHPRNQHPGTYYRSSPTGDFAGMVRRMKEFIRPGGWGGANLARMDDDAAIPGTPTVTSIGPADFPANALTFTVSDFTDPQGNDTVAAAQWRIAEVAPASLDARAAGKYEIEALWESPEIDRFDEVVRMPAGVVQPGGTYRVRCRMKDDTGRWSHWSAPIQFVVGEPIPYGTVAHLRITELMYNPPDPPQGDDTDNEEFEFVELKNIGAETLDLSSVSFTEGITFDFDGSDVTTLEPAEFVLIVKSRTAFESRYGSVLSHLIAGEYSGRLSNGGEPIRLVDFWDGTILAFDYSDEWYDETDGRGYSLTVRDPAGTDPGDWGDETTWKASTDVGGSPGTQ